MLCVYHTDCVDGLAAAWVVKTRFPEARLMDMQYPAYSSPEILPEYEEGEEIYIVDFSFSGHALTHHFAKAGKVYVYDHHADAIDKLAMYFASNPLPDNVELVLDESRSGAGITWDEINGGARPLMIDHVEDRDLFRFNHHGTREYFARLAMEPMTVEAYAEFQNEMYTTILKEGSMLLRQRKQLIDFHLAKSGRKVKFGGYEVMAYNAPYYIASDLAAAAGKNVPFVIIYSVEDGMMRYNVRADRETGLDDVRPLARLWGGGGHVKASGFRVSLDTVVFDE